MITDFIYDISPNNQTDLICIAGPTASGKSDFAIKLAQKSKATVINADSCQVYKELQILTARPTQSEMCQIPHLLYGHISLETQYSVQLWCQEVSKHINDIISRGGRVILVGGTGLYFYSLLNGIAKIPDISPDIRDNIRKMSTEEIHKALLIEDPIAASKFHFNDTQRLGRALEVVRSTGKPISVWQENTASFLPNGVRHETFALMPNRDALYARINKRFDMMIEKGAIEEAEKIKKDFAKDNKYKSLSKKIVGLSELVNYLDGECTYEDAILYAKQSSRRYAKRQMTWFKNKGTFKFVIS